MQRLIRDVTRTSDRGAVAVVFALCLVVLLGFVGLAVDVGSAYAKSQEVQNAADAGALAIAQECADADPLCVAEGQRPLAGNLATSNIRTGYDPAQLPGVAFPATNRVTVAVTAQNENFFASLFGYESFTITREATAQWDAPQRGPATIPLTISACEFFNQAGEPMLDQNLYVWLPLGKVLEDTEAHCGVLEYPPGGFGWLDHGGDCVAEARVGEWIPGDVGANRPDACMMDLLNVGDTFLIPIFDDFRGTGNAAEFHIQRFAAVELMGWHFTEGGPTIQEPVRCPDETRPSKSDYRNSCLNIKFVEWTDVGDGYTGGGPETEVAIVRLVDPAYEDRRSE